MSNPSIDQALAITVGMVEIRDGLKLLYGDRYNDNVSLARKIIRGLSASQGISLANAALDVAARMDAAGIVPHVVIAALVDEVQGQ